jgi:TPR repeat protein
VGRWAIFAAAVVAMMVAADAEGVLADPCYATDWDSCVVDEVAVVGHEYVRYSELELRARRRSLRKRCEHGDASACVVLGIMQASGVGGSTDKIGSEYSLWRACEVDSGACIPVATALRSGNHVAKDDNLARAILKLGGVIKVPYISGAAGRVAGELLAGDLYENEGTDRGVVLDAYLQECEGKGVAEACAKAAAMYDQGAGTERDKRSAYRYFWLACDLDRSLCMDIAQAYDKGKRVGRNRKHSRKFRKLAIQREGTTSCRYGDTERCVTYGYAYLQGEHVGHDEEYAAVLFSEACDAGSASGCTGLAALRWSGQGIAKNRAKAVELYQSACDEREGAACWKLGRLYMRGEHVDQDTKRAEKLFERACDLGDQAGCNYMAKKP